MLSLLESTAQLLRATADLAMSLGFMQALSPHGKRSVVRQLPRAPSVAAASALGFVLWANHVRPSPAQKQPDDRDVVYHAFTSRHPDYLFRRSPILSGRMQYADAFCNEICGCLMFELH
jgi:hypothetical protein